MKDPVLEKVSTDEQERRCADSAGDTERESYQRKMLGKKCLDSERPRDSPAGLGFFS